MDGNMKKYLFIIIAVFLLTLVLFFVYKGFYPFNSGVGQYIHFYVYDNYHIAFNHSNMKYMNDSYWCKESNRDAINERAKRLEYIAKEQQKVSRNIIKLESEKFSTYELKQYTLEIEESIEFAHTFKYNNYYDKAKILQQQLQNKYEYNKKIDANIKELEKHQDKLKMIEEIEFRKLLKDYCVKVQ